MATDGHHSGAARATGNRQVAPMASVGGMASARAADSTQDSKQPSASAPQSPGVKGSESRVFEDYHTTLRFWALMYPASFLLTFVLASVVTFTATEYDPQTDFIEGFFGVFNPCMFFDHYPANVVATVFVGVWMAVGVIFNLVLFLIVYHMRNQLYTTMTGMLFAFVAFADVAFINIITANIYVDFPNEDPLPCCNDPMTVELPQSTINRISMHGGFYNVSLAFSLLLCMWFIGAVKHLYYPYKVPVWVYVVLVVNILVQVVSIEGMLTTIMAGGASTDKYKDRASWSNLQRWSIDTEKALHVTLWNWMLALGWRLVVPRGLGVRLRFELGTAYDGTFCQATDFGCNTFKGLVCSCPRDVAPAAPARNANPTKFNMATTHPRKIVASVFKILAAMLLFTYLLQDPSANADVTLRISAGFRELPYTYIFAPMWIIITMMTAFGVWTSIMQRQLELQEFKAHDLDGATSTQQSDPFGQRRITAMWITGGFWVVAMVCDLLIIVPMFDMSYIAAYATLIAIPLWVVAAYYNPEPRYRYRTVAWVVCWIVLSVLSTETVWAALLQLVLMMVLPYLDPGARGLEISSVVTYAGSWGGAVGSKQESDSLP